MARESLNINQSVSFVISRLCFCLNDQNLLLKKDDDKRKTKVETSVWGKGKREKRRSNPFNLFPTQKTCRFGDVKQSKGCFER